MKQTHTHKKQKEREEERERFNTNREQRTEKTKEILISPFPTKKNLKKNILSTTKSSLFEE